MDGKELITLGGAALSATLFGKIALIVAFIVLVTMISERLLGWFGRKMQGVGGKAIAKAKSFGTEVKQTADRMRNTSNS